MVLVARRVALLETLGEPGYVPVVELIECQQFLVAGFERLGRDIRGSRGVDAGATDNNLVLWIDYNSDYVRNQVAQADEIITWSVLDQGTGQYNTLRQTAGGDVQLQSRTLVSNLAFCYLTEPSDDPADCLPTPLSADDAEATRLISVTLEYDSALNYGTESRTTTFAERIRNVS